MTWVVLIIFTHCLVLLRPGCLIHQGLSSSVDFFTEGEGARSSCTAEHNLPPPAPGQEKAQGTMRSPSETSHACRHVRSPALTPGQPSLGEPASVVFKPKYISLPPSPPNQIQYLNEWKHPQFSFVFLSFVDKTGKQKGMYVLFPFFLSFSIHKECMFFVFYSCTVFASLRHIFWSSLSEFSVAKGRQ